MRQFGADKGKDAPGLEQELASRPQWLASKLFPLAAHVVHGGGVGTINQVLRSGIPSLCISSVTEQEANGQALMDLGVSKHFKLFEVLSRVLSRQRLTGELVDERSTGALDQMTTTEWEL